MTVQEFIKDLAKKAKVDEQSEDFQMMISASALKDVEVPKSVLNAVNSNFLTRDAALNDKEIFNGIKGNVHSSFSDIISENLDGFELPDDFKNELKENKSAADKLKRLLSQVKEATKNKKPSQSVNEQIEKLNNELKAREDKIKELTTGFENEKNSLLQNFKQKEMQKEFMNKIYQFDIADNIPGGKNYLANATFEELNNQFHIDYKDDVGFVLKDKENPELDAYVNNQKVSIDDLLKTKLEPFVKKQPARQEPSEKFSTGDKPNVDPNSLQGQKLNWWQKQEAS